EAAEISDLSLNDNPTRAICTLHRSDPRRPGVLLRRYDTTPGVKADTMITRFVNNALIAANIEPVGSHSAREIVVDTFDKSGRNGSLSAFENALWRFQSDS
ncbi:hypothetical protein, partial [Brevibacterium casei]|uniref:hypothetical protein n=1 Tax=Brevibacterium casei TaxID=33889 RepID=UPI003158D6A5